MRKLYQINKYLVIVNAIFFIVPFFGLLFLIPLGAIQVFMAIIIGLDFSKLNKDLKAKFIVYSVMTIIILSILYYISNVTTYISSDSVGIAVIISSIMLAFLHLHITYLLSKACSNNI